MEDLLKYKRDFNNYQETIFDREYGNQDTETLYRSMSWDEFHKRHGELEQRKNADGSWHKEGPFITKSFAYAESTMTSYSKKEQVKYDIIVAYTMPKGTFELLKNISLPRNTKVAEAVRQNLPVRKGEDAPDDENNVNIGFPGYTADTWFNKYILKVQIKYIKNEEYFQ